MEQVLKCFDCQYRGHSDSFEDDKCPECKSNDNYVLSQIRNI